LLGELSCHPFLAHPNIHPLAGIPTFGYIWYLIVGFLKVQYGPIQIFLLVMMLKIKFITFAQWYEGPGNVHFWFKTILKKLGKDMFCISLDSLDY